MPWHKHLRIEIAETFRRLSTFRFWYERGERKMRLLKTNYEGCVFLETRPTDKKRARDRLRNWMRGAKPRILMDTPAAKAWREKRERIMANPAKNALIKQAARIRYRRRMSRKREGCKP